MAPMSGWINGAQLIPEGKPYKVDSSSRIVVPSHLRAKFGIEIGEELDYYTTFVDGRWFLCVTKQREEKTDD
jgi:bifunctional DNA-binding transcriptional regulator/antitoxin component of YhaV-PrlF toxin-antitoxin module